MYSFPNVKMHLAQGLKHSDGKSCFHSSLRLVSPEHHAQAEVGDASCTGDRAGSAAVVLAGSSRHRCRHATR